MAQRLIPFYNDQVMPPRWVSKDAVLFPDTDKEIYVVMGQTQIILSTDLLCQNIFNCFIINENLPSFENEGEGVIFLKDLDDLTPARLYFTRDSAAKVSALIYVRGK